jgi:hypothetical protein
MKRPSMLARLRGKTFQKWAVLCPLSGEPEIYTIINHSYLMNTVYRYTKMNKITILA